MGNGKENACTIAWEGTRDRAMKPSGIHRGRQEVGYSGGQEEVMVTPQR